MGSTARAYDEGNIQELFHGLVTTREVQAWNVLGWIFGANKMVPNLQASNVKSSFHTVGQMWCIPEANSVRDVMCTESNFSHRSVCVISQHIYVLLPISREESAHHLTFLYT